MVVSPKMITICILTLFLTCVLIKYSWAMGKSLNANMQLSLKAEFSSTNPLGLLHYISNSSHMQFPVSQWILQLQPELGYLNLKLCLLGFLSRKQLIKLRCSFPPKFKYLSKMSFFS